MFTTVKDLFRNVSGGVTSTAKNFKSRKGGVKSEKRENQNEKIDQKVIKLECLNNLFSPDQKEYVYAGRKAYYDAIFANFIKKKRKNTILVGRNGVGKEAIIRGVAERIVKGNCPNELKKSVVIKFDLEQICDLINECENLSDLIKGIIIELKKIPNMILYIKSFSLIENDEIIFLLKTVAEETDTIIIGTIETENFYEDAWSTKEKLFLKRFEIIEIDPPRSKEIYEILKYEIKRLEKAYGIIVERENFERLVNLAFQNLNEELNLEYIVDLLDTALAYASIRGSKTLNIRSVLETKKIDIMDMKELPLSEIRSTASHEAAHAVVAIETKDAPRFISIVPEEHVLGANVFEKTQKTLTREECIDELAAMLAGCAACEVIDLPYTNGCSSDLTEATIYAYNIILSWGMPATPSGETSLYSFYSEGKFKVDLISEKDKTKFKKIVESLLDEGMERAKEILMKRIDAHSRITEALYKALTLTQNEVLELYEGKISPSDIQDPKWEEIN